MLWWSGISIWKVLNWARVVNPGVLWLLAADFAQCPPPVIASGSAGVIEVREYTLKPEGIKPFMEVTARNAALRASCLPWLGMFTCDAGGTMNRVVHFYHYEHLDQRDAIRAKLAGNEQWQVSRVS